MTSIREIFTTFGPEYLQRYATTMPTNHRKVLDAIMACRTEACGMAYYQCESCAEPQRFFCSCGNRHCPTCQHSKTQQWLQSQIHRQLPGHHFLITFTVPQQLRSFMRQHQRLGYSALFKASSEAIKKLAADPKHIGGDLPGFFGVLHTWGRTLQYHPHIHYIGFRRRHHFFQRFLASFQNGFLSPCQSPLENLSSQVPRPNQPGKAIGTNSQGGLADRLEC